jgi:hypothetical protein
VVVVVRGLKTEMTSGRAMILMLVIILSQFSSINNSKQHRDRNRIWFVFNLFSTCTKKQNNSNKHFCAKHVLTYWEKIFMMNWFS